ncbi:DUF3352 domain-containing protein [Leptolyngbya sp. PCC 6406]|uniref:DUF3352 domain-containing protein n=1 Tax=Leptolyngbya sp. PCC 6406 TaxID=1173264 RepID=UPI0002ACEA6E|nr:DUF3352 domain-containing protein [Leptolyngbya sp. PCC 6406]
MEKGWSFPKFQITKFAANCSDAPPPSGKTFAQLNEVVESRYRFQVQRRQVEYIPLTDWVSPFQSVTLTHGWLNNTVVFLAIGEGTATAIAPKPSCPLNTRSLFQLATSAAPQPNNGHFYLNLDALAQGDDNLFLPAFPPETQGMLQALQGIGVTTTILDERRLRYDLFVALKRGNRPGPLPPLLPPRRRRYQITWDSRLVCPRSGKMPDPQELHIKGSGFPRKSLIMLRNDSSLH